MLAAALKKALTRERRSKREKIEEGSAVERVIESAQSAETAWQSIDQILMRMNLKLAASVMREDHVSSAKIATMTSAVHVWPIEKRMRMKKTSQSHTE